MRLGIFGGTFDPPHQGHLILAAEACDQLDLERLLWVLTPDPPHKPDRTITPVNHRLDMVQAAIASNPNFEISSVEMDRPPPHYALDTVKILRGKYKHAELIYIMGGDSLYDLPTWHKPIDLVRSLDQIAVFRRPGDHVDLSSSEEQIPGVTQKVILVEAPLLEISSSQVRQRVAQKRPFRYYLPPPVYEIIQQRGLYT